MERRFFLNLFAKAAAIGGAGLVVDKIQGLAEKSGLIVPDRFLDEIPRPLIIPGSDLWDIRPATFEDVAEYNNLPFGEIPSEKAFLDEINQISLKHIMPGLVDQFFKNSPILDYMKRVKVEEYYG